LHACRSTLEDPTAAALGVANVVATPTRVPLPSALGGGAGGGALLRSAAGGAAQSLATTASGEVWAYLTLSPNSNPNSITLTLTLSLTLPNSKP